MKVQAKQIGYYQHKRRREGEFFNLIDVKGKNDRTIPAAVQFSSKWMTDVDNVLNLPINPDDEMIESGEDKAPIQPKKRTRAKQA